MQPHKEKKQQIFWKDLLLRDMGDAFFRLVGSVWLFIKAELEQGSDKPLFYAVFGIPVDMPVFNGGDIEPPRLYFQTVLSVYCFNPGYFCKNTLSATVNAS